MKKNDTTTRLIIVGLLLALEIILTRFCSISTPILRMGFGFLPIAMIGILFGPWWAAVTYALGDFIGAVLFPIGPYFPGFTLGCFLSGLIFGFVFYKHPVTCKRTLLASCLVVLGVDLLLNTYWLSVLYGDAFVALLPTRIIKVAFAIPIQVLLIPLVWRRILCKVPFIKSLPAQPR